jgi:hypothetical protein
MLFLSFIFMFDRNKSFLVTIAKGKHLFPFRTEKLSPYTPMVLRAQVRGRVGSRQDFNLQPRSIFVRGFFMP